LLLVLESFLYTSCPFATDLVPLRDMASIENHSHSGELIVTWAFRDSFEKLSRNYRHQRLFLDLSPASQWQRRWRYLFSLESEADGNTCSHVSTLWFDRCGFLLW
jgi:hypothetical protein